MKEIGILLEKLNENVKSLLPDVESAINEEIKFIHEQKEEYYLRKKSGKNEDMIFVKEFENKIELNLDYLMNPFTEKYFLLLLENYKEISPESANYYMKMYKEM
jgi:hypothetical protein